MTCPQRRALLLAYLGIDDKEPAIDMVARGYEERDNYEINIGVDPLMDPLRNNPRFEMLCRQVMLGRRSEVPDIVSSTRPPTFRR